MMNNFLDDLYDEDIEELCNAKYKSVVTNKSQLFD